MYPYAACICDAVPEAFLPYGTVWAGCSEERIVGRVIVLG